ncbi:MULTISPECIES: hypothetical protein [Streptomyces]|nr:hypothetical protein [Streptomyces griseolus]
MEFRADAVHAPGRRPAGHHFDLAAGLDRLAKRGTVLQMGVVSPE